MAFISPGSTWGALRSLALEVTVRIGAFKHSGQKRRVFLAPGAPRRLQVGVVFDDRHADGGVLRHSHLGRGRIGADGLDTEPMREDAVMPRLIHLGRDSFNPGASNPVL